MPVSGEVGTGLGVGVGVWPAGVVGLEVTDGVTGAVAAPAEQAASVTAAAANAVPTSTRTGQTLGRVAWSGDEARAGGAPADKHAEVLASSGGKWSTVAPLGETKVTNGA